MIVVPPESDSQAGQPRQDSPPANRATVLLLVAFSLALYVVTTGYGFVVDDEYLLVRNPFTRSFHYLAEVFTQPFWAFRGAALQDNFYRPLVTLTLLLERSLFGLRPAGYHLVNVLLNAAVVVLVYLWAKRLWLAGHCAVWAALLFAALPVHTENVAPVFGISDLECAAFLLGSVLLYMRGAETHARFPRLTACGAAALFGLATLAKEVALALPVMLLFYEYGLHGSGEAKRSQRWHRLAPTFLVAGAYLALRWHVFHGFASSAGVVGPSAAAAARAGLSLLAHYLFKLVWPLRLVFFQPFPFPRSWFDPWVLAGVVLALSTIAAFAYFWKRQRTACFALLWVVLTLAPVLMVRWLGKSPLAERYLYLPSVGFCCLLSYGLGRLRHLAIPHEARLRWSEALPVILVVLAAARTLARLPEWRSNFTLAAATLRDAPDVAACHVYLGLGYAAEGQALQARQEYATAMALDPSLIEAYVDLANALIADGDLEKARKVLEQAIRQDARVPEAHYAMGMIALAQGQRESAHRALETAVELNPNYPEALNNLALMLAQEGQSRQAQELLERAIRAAPDYGEAWNNLGSVYAREGDLPRAEAAFRQASGLGPSSELPYLNLAGLYEQAQNPSAALAMYRAAVRVAPSSANAQFRLGVLALKLGNVPEALAALQRAATLQPQSAEAHTQLGLAFRAAGNLASARQEIETALRLDPGDSAAREALQKLR